MTAIRSIAEGVRRVARSPKLIAGLWLVSVAAALPAALVMREVLAESIGGSLFHASLSEGFDDDWYAEFEAEAKTGLARTFGPGVIGVGAVYDNLEAWWSGRLFTDFPVGLVSLGVAYALLWTFLAGGVLDRLAGHSARPGGLAGFLAACGRTFGSFLLLALASGVAYALIYLLGRRLYGWIEDSARDVTSERTVLLRVLLAAALVVALLHLVRMVFDYARIAVYSDGVSALRGLRRGVAFVAARPGRTAAVYAGLGLVALLLVAVYAGVAPGAGASSALTVVLAFLVSQLYLVARLAVRLSVLGAELHLFRSS
ncbi:MAG TPA: hypothetical protein VGG06_18385 [Thermoanaerobaculia bacterium]|jgi:hypothetical protein